jgi:hypothetical protein
MHVDQRGSQNMDQKQTHYRNAVTTLQSAVDLIDSLPDGIGHDLAEEGGQLLSSVVEQIREHLGDEVDPELAEVLDK